MHLPLVPCHLLFYVPTVPDGFAAEVDIPNIYEQNTRWLDLNPLNLIHPQHHNLCHTHRICLLNHQVLFRLTICNHLFPAVCCHLLMICDHLLLIYCYLLMICDHLLSICCLLCMEILILLAWIWVPKTIIWIRAMCNQNLVMDCMKMHHLGLA